MFPLSLPCTPESLVFFFSSTNFKRHYDSSFRSSSRTLVSYFVLFFSGPPFCVYFSVARLRRIACVIYMDCNGGGKVAAKVMKQEKEAKREEVEDKEEEDEEELKGMLTKEMQKREHERESS